MNRFCPQRFRQQFPIFNQTAGDNLIYLDNAATTQKPQCVVDASSHFYQTSNANVHRASHKLSSLATQKFEQARLAVQQFINAQSEKEIIWTKGTTESINLIAQTYGKQTLNSSDEIVVSHAEHHANIVPWQEVAQSTGAVIKPLPLAESGRIDSADIESLITESTAIVSIALVSNVVGKVNPVEKLIQRAREVGAIVIIDAAQAIAHKVIDVQALDCDFLVFSAHKMFGPTGIGVLYGKEALLTRMPPYQFGGEMIKKVSFSGTTYGSLPFKFEPGTPNIVGAIGFAEAIHFMQAEVELGMFAYEHQLTAYTYQALAKLPKINWLFNICPDVPVFSFTIEGHHNQDIASYLNENNIAIRAGHHCAMPLMEYMKQPGCIRVSLSPYNTFQDVDRLVACLQQYIAGEVEHTTTKLDETASIKLLLSKAKGWDGKHREIMLLGKKLERMPKALRSSTSLVDGCESDAWLVSMKDHHHNWYFQADSDAKIIRGLLVVILVAFQGKNTDEILAYDIESYFESLGLIQHLSPSRGNGIRAIVNKIKTLISTG